MVKPLSTSADGYSRELRRLPLLVAFLACMPAVALGVYLCPSRVRLGILGWPHALGPVLLGAVAMLTCYLVARRQPLVQTTAMAGLLVLSVCAEALNELLLPSGPFLSDTLLGILALLSLPLLAACIVYRLRAPWPARIGCLAIGAYIESVHLFNALSPNRHIGLFEGGGIS